MKKKVAYVTEKQYINIVHSHINAIKYMHDLTVNFQKMLQITNSVLKQDINQDGNLHFYPRKPSFQILKSLHFHFARNAWVAIARIGFY
ncbi:hypothetical protein [Mucilaginibacter flavidus]|uniref:hypothetical protein n=1 Tax=Mucilaginibacter flavidus TaxID=2949309 RepID=UPI0020933C3A|nr:hypothetical protein [Mucilaginibacter flavidus]